MNIGIVGGGVASIAFLLAAAHAASEDTFEVFESGERLLSRIPISGNGRCNLLNTHIFDPSQKNYLSRGELISSPFNDGDKNRLKAFIDSLRIQLWSDSKGRVYPFSNSAKSVESAFLTQLEKISSRVLLHFNTLVTKVDTAAVSLITSAEKRHFFDQLFIGAGGRSYDRKTPSIAFCPPLRSTPLFPALGPIRPDFTWPKKLVGQRARGHLTILVRGEKIYEEDGELLFKDHKLSGICLFNASLLARIDPSATLLDFDLGRCEEQCAITTDDRSSYLPPKLLEAAEELPLSGSHLLFHLVEFPEFFESQVSGGGIDPTILGASNELKSQPRIRFGGEMIDVTGLCGGFNLAYALITGLRAAVK